LSKQEHITKLYKNDFCFHRFFQKESIVELKKKNDLKEKGKIMSEEFLWGSATAAYQCEGAWKEDGKVESIWDVYLHENNLENGDIASDHYHHVEEDIRMLAEGGQNAYRFSISWPRIIMNEQGKINSKGIAFYEKVIDTCLKYGVEPFVTCYHWDLPQYLQEKGGWLNKETAKAFAYYCKVLFEAFNGKIKHWTTFNEPKWFLFSGYQAGNYPPGHQNDQELITACYNVMLANALAIAEFKKAGTSGQIGIVCSYTTTYPSNDSPECLEAAMHADNYANNWDIETALTGKFPAAIRQKLEEQGLDLSFVQKEELEIIAANTSDFLGMNYYAPQFVLPYQGGETSIKVNNQGKKYKGDMHTVVKGWFEIDDEKMKHLPQNDWNMVIYPQGLFDGLKRNSRFGKPIFITENGLGNYEDQKGEMVQDDERIAYIKEHVAWMLKAKAEGVDVNEYFVWSTFDLYSWKNGCEKRYGLVGVDFQNGCSRHPKKSYYWYKEQIKSDWKELRSNL
jgi:beta-glucosidase